MSFQYQEDLAAVNQGNCFGGCGGTRRWLAHHEARKPSGKQRQAASSLPEQEVGGNNRSAASVKPPYTMN
jgi:hypothetical protein